MGPGEPGGDLDCLLACLPPGRGSPKRGRSEGGQKGAHLGALLYLWAAGYLVLSVPDAPALHGACFSLSSAVLHPLPSLHVLPPRRGPFPRASVSAQAFGNRWSLKDQQCLETMPFHQNIPFFIAFWVGFFCLLPDLVSGFAFSGTQPGRIEEVMV